jgi:diphthine-ammonia ligase
MKLCVLYSGGKDSTLALIRASRKAEISCLVTVRPDNPESFMFHTPNVWLTSLQADAMGIPLVVRKTKGAREKELSDLREALREARDRYGAEGAVTGAIASVYQASRVQRICHELGMSCVNPLWLMDQRKVLEEGLREGLDVIVSGVFAEGFGEEWLGRRIDGEAIRKLAGLSERFGISPSGEGGEIETTVLDAPVFGKRIDIEESEVVMEGDSGTLMIRKAGLVGK